MTVSSLPPALAILALAAAPFAQAIPAATFTVTDVEPDNREAFLATNREKLGNARGSSGFRVDLLMDTANPNRILRFELWPDQDALAAHLAHPAATAEQAPANLSLVLTPYSPASADFTSTTSADGDTSTVIVVFEASEALEQEFLSEFDKLEAETRRSPDNLTFELYRVPGKPGTHVLFERWKTPADYATHLTRPHVRDFYKHFPSLVSHRTRYIATNIP